MSNFRLLIEGLKANKSLEKLNLSNNLLFSDYSALMKDFLTGTTKLRELVYEGNLFKDDFHNDADDFVKEFMK